MWWVPVWRADQKDRPQREAAAEAGIQAFFAERTCFAEVLIHSSRDLHAALKQAEQVPQHGSGHAPAPGAAHTPDGSAVPQVALVMAVRELGPTLQVGSGPLWVDGATEVKLDVHLPGLQAAQRSFSIHWRNGGAGNIKGVATLPQDMRDALAAGLKP